MSKRLRNLLIVLVVFIITGVTAFHYAELYLSKKIQASLNEATINQIDAFMEDLASDEEITAKLNDLAIPQDKIEALSMAPQVESLEDLRGSTESLDTAPEEKSAEARPVVVSDVGQDSNNTNSPTEKVEQTPEKTTKNPGGNIVRRARKEVAISDQIRGAQLMGKADVGYALTLSIPELKKYLKAQYSQGEINEIKTFYSQYSYILTEEMMK